LVKIYRHGRKHNNYFSLNFISLAVFATEQLMHCDRYRILLTYRLFSEILRKLVAVKTLILDARHMLFVRIHRTYILAYS